MPIRAMSPTREQSVARYFNQAPDEVEQAKAFGVMVVGVVLGIFGVVQVFLASFVLALLFIIAGAVVFWWGKARSDEYDEELSASKNKPADRKMADLLQRDLDAATGWAMRRLHLVAEDLEIESSGSSPFPVGGGEDRKPLLVVGPDLTGRSRTGMDGTPRFERYQVMVICPTSYQLAIYRGVLDFRTGRWLREETYEYHYSDVVAVSTTVRPLDAGNRVGRKKDDRQATSVLTFQISVSSSEKCSVAVGIWDEDDPDAHQPLWETGIDPVVDSVRRVLRDKKGGTAVLT